MAESFRIDHVGRRGDGVPSDEAATFVPFTLPGETVEAERKADGRARLARVIEPSPQRVQPFCPFFGACGGCAIQHWEQGAYLAWKRKLVLSALRQAGIEADVAPIIDAHGAGRRRATFHARQGADGLLRVGFAAAHSHAIVAIEHCPILDPALTGALEAARAIASALEPAHKPLDIQITAASEGLDIDVRGSGPLSSSLIGALTRLGSTHRIARLTRHGEMVFQHRPPTIAIGRTTLGLPPGSFLQATAAGEQTLAALVVEHCSGAKRIADLFCGVGPFALRLAEAARIDAYDSEPGAVAALSKAAAGTPRLKPITASARDLFRGPLTPNELRDFNAVVIDPPRQGAQAQAQQLARSAVPLVIAVSCDIATFTRDAATLMKGGYKMGHVTPIDQFRHTPHVELVAAFTR